MKNPDNEKRAKSIDQPKASIAFDALLSQYTGVHYVNFLNDEVVSYMISDRISDTGEMMKNKVHFSQMWSQFVSMAVHPEDKEEMLRFGNTDFLMRLLAVENTAKHIFRRGYAEGYLYTLMKIIVVERDEGKPVSIVLIFDEANDEISRTFHMEQYLRNAETQKRVTEGLAVLVESRDLNTGAHIERTRRFYSMLVEQLRTMNMFEELNDDSFCENINYGSILHDVGKIYISDVILNKQGGLTAEEFDIIKTHTTFGASIVEDLFAKSVDDEAAKILRDIVLYHHERWDGNGYPNGLAGEEIPLCARIMAVTDVFDALISKRSYKNAMSIDDAYDTVISESGTHFDERIIEAFKAIKPQVEEFLSEMNGSASPIADTFSKQMADSSRRVTVVNKLIDEYESIYFVNMDSGVLHAIKSSGLQISESEHMNFNEAVLNTLHAIGEDDRRKFSNLADMNYLRGYLQDEDRKEFIFHMAGTGEMRRCIIQVASRKDGEPAEVIFSFMKVDDERTKNIKLTEELERNYAIIEILASEYMAVYHVNLGMDEMIPYRQNAAVEKIMVGPYENDMKFSRSMDRYSKTGVSPEDMSMIRSISSIPYIRKELARKKTYSRIYQNEVHEYREIKFVKLGGVNDMPETVAMAFMDIDKEYRKKHNIK